MKLSGRDAARFFAKPQAGRTGILLYGPDSMRVALKRQSLVEAVIGPDGAQEMRLTRMAGNELRKDRGLLADAIKAQGFFPGPRAVLLEEASDTLAKTITVALSDWQPGDAFVVVTAGQLTARSSLRKLFEGHPNAYAVAIYTDPPTHEEIEATLNKAGLSNLGSAAMADLTALARAIDPGDFDQTMEKLALYKLKDDTPVSPEDVAACAPVTIEASLDDAIHLIAEARAADVVPMMKRLQGQGVNPTTVCIGATRHFRALHAAACHPQGPDTGLARARPPVFGPRKDRMARQARAWGMHRLENALGILTDTDLSLRSARPVPARAMLERAFIRIAMLAQK